MSDTYASNPVVEGKEDARFQLARRFWVQAFRYPLKQADFGFGICIERVVVANGHVHTRSCTHTWHIMTPRR